jgi:exopolyphosphatase / guanosine-5'-triphosphate,3'-diphosphate pyrophosphatase
MVVSALDIGTNTILMVIGKLEANGKITILSDEHSIARLGKGVDANGTISNEAIERAERILDNYSKICSSYNVDIRVGVATSAVRDASNKNEVIKRLSKVSNAMIHCISGDEEAKLSYQGSIVSERYDEFIPTVVIDIGGGSTEIILGKGNMILSRYSINIGAVRLTERFSFTPLPPDPQNLDESREYIRHQIISTISQDAIDEISNSKVIAVAGTPTTLAAIELSGFDKNNIDGYILNSNTIAQQSMRLTSLTHKEIIEIPGVHAERADILPAGTLILDTLVQTLGFAQVKVSTKGLRYGVLYSALDSLVKR